jgi:hypothetical protein
MLRVLAGPDAAVELLVDGGRRGRVSLAGSTAAVREALAGCLPMAGSRGGIHRANGADPPA